MKVLVVGSCNTFYIRSYIDLLSQSNNIELAYINNNLTHKFTPDETIKVFNYSSANESTPVRNSVKPAVSFIKTIAKKLHLEDSQLQRTIMSFLRGQSKKKELQRLELFARNFSPDVIFFFWGTTLFEEVKVLNRLHKPMVLSVNTYPTSFDKNFIPTNIDRLYFENFDGLIFPSQLMSDYFLANKLTKSTNKNLVNPDFIGPSINSPVPNKALKKGVNKVIFLGNVNFSHRNGDDIRNDIVTLASSGIEVYIQESCDGNFIHENVKFYKPFDYEDIKKGELINFINDYFDAVLYCYNTQESLREKLSVTTRFSLCESCSVPILIKKGKYLAIEEQFSEKVNFILYNEISDIAKNEFEIRSSKYSHYQSDREKCFIKYINSFKGQE